MDGIKYSCRFNKVSQQMRLGGIYLVDKEPNKARRGAAKQNK